MDANVSDFFNNETESSNVEKKLLETNNITNIEFLHNNACKAENTIVCGTRGWICETGNDERGEILPPDIKMQKREAGRLEKSILSGFDLAEEFDEIVVFLHYPPIYSYEENEYILEVLEKYAIKRVFSGHIHSSGMNKAFIGERYGIRFYMVTADSIDFTPILVQC